MSETEGSPGLWKCRWGKEWVGCVLSFPVCTESESGDPFPQCAHWGLPLKGAAPCGARCAESPPLAPPLGELSSASETERAERVPMGKRIVGVRPVFSGLHRVPPRRPLRRFAALSKTARRLTATTVIPRPVRTLVVGIRIPLGQTDYQLRRKRERIATSLRSSQ